MTHRTQRRRARRTSLRSFLLVGSALAFAACGDDPKPGEGADTGTGMDAGTDVGGEDASTDATIDVPEPESLLVVLTRENTDRSGEVQLVVTDTECRPSLAQLCEPGTCDETVVEPRSASEPLCNVSCRVTPDLSHVVFADPSQASTLRIAPMGSDFQLSEDSTIVATDVAEYFVAEDMVAYRTGNDIHLYTPSTGADSSVYTFASQGAFSLSNDGSKIFVGEVTSLTSMDLTAVDTASGAVLPVFHFIAGQEQGTGSYYTGREPMSLSPDGTRLAVVTDALTAGSLCSSNADCTEPGSQCLTTAVRPRCVRQELTLNVINLNETDRLRTACASDAECGADHFCDLSVVNEDAKGECLPGRFLLGPSGPRACETLSLGQYASSKGDLAWRGERTVVGVFAQKCITGNIDVTDVVALNLDGAAFERIEENPERDHGGCYDDVEACFDAAECAVEIERVTMSPSGQTLALVADSVTSSQKSELWLLDAFGTEGKTIVTSSIFWEVKAATLHEMP